MGVQRIGSAGWGAALGDASAPIDRARGLPNAVYADPDAFIMERDRIFHGGWVCAGFAADAPGPGDVCPLSLLGAPLLMARDRAGTLRVFHNVCRHRGMILVEAPRKVEGAIRCPYHSWCYATDGRLAATPHVGGPGVNAHDAVPKKETGLLPVRMAEWMGCVFVDLSGAAPAFEDWIAPLAGRWSDFAGRPVYRGKDSSFTLDVACNWKLAVENYCESYHLPWVHPGLNAYSKLEDHYNILGDGGFSGQGTRVYNPDLEIGHFPDFQGLPSVWDRQAEYIALYPNLLLGVHRDHTFAILLEPLSHERTRERVELFYTTEDAAIGDDHAALRARNAALWKEVFIEDIFVVEGMQKGRNAPGFDGGRFSPVMDEATHAFHAWAAARYAQ